MLITFLDVFVLRHEACIYGILHTSAEVPSQHGLAAADLMTPHVDAAKAELGEDLRPKRVRSEPRMRRLSVQFDPASIMLDSEAGG